MHIIIYIDDTTQVQKVHVGTHIWSNTFRLHLIDYEFLI